jgi:hypothetical protein
VNGVDDRVIPLKRRAKFRRESRKLSFILYQALYEPIIFLHTVYRQIAVLGVMFLAGARSLHTMGGCPQSPRC